MKSVPLAELLAKLYEENSRHEIGPPIKMIKELEFNSLLISDIETSDEDIHVLIRFLANKQVISQIEKIEVTKSSGGKSSTKRSTSALNSSGCRFFKDLIHFIEHCERLKSVTFEQIEIPAEMLPKLGKALTHSKSTIRWVGFHVCKFGGDEGLRVLTPFLASMKLQVLGLEYCELTDKSTPYIISILKAQENRLDSLYWNSTLRVDAFYDQDGSRLEQETSQVYGQGLVALSLNGNFLTEKSVLPLCRVLRMNYWLLGLNLANNRLDAEAVEVFVESLRTNTIIQSVLLKNNPGFLESSKPMVLLYKILGRNSSDTAAVAPLEQALNTSTTVLTKASNGKARLSYLPLRVAEMLKCWKMLHLIECNTAIAEPSSSSGDNKQQQHPDESLLTQSSTSLTRNRYQQGINEDVKTARSKEKGLGAAYSIFQFLEREPSALQTGSLVSSFHNSSLKKTSSFSGRPTVTLPSPFADVNLSTDETETEMASAAAAAGGVGGRVGGASVGGDALNTSSISASGAAGSVVTAGNGTLNASTSYRSHFYGSPRRYLNINGVFYDGRGTSAENATTADASFQDTTLPPAKNYPVSPLERRTYFEVASNSERIMASIEDRLARAAEAEEQEEARQEDQPFMTALPLGSPHRYASPTGSSGSINGRARRGSHSPVQDPLEHAIAPISPSQFLASHRSPHRYSLDDEDPYLRPSAAAAATAAAGAAVWDHQKILGLNRSSSDDRPPSRISIRPITDLLINGGIDVARSNNNGNGSGSNPTASAGAGKGHRTDRYLPMLQRYAAGGEGDGRPLSRGRARPRTASAVAASSAVAAGTTNGKKTAHKKKTAVSTANGPNYLRPRSASAVKERPTTQATAAAAAAATHSRPTVVIPTVKRSASASKATRKSQSEAPTTGAAVQKSAGYGKSARETRVRSRSNERRRLESGEEAVKIVKPTPSRRSVGGANAAAPSAPGPVDTASLSYLVTLQGLTNTFLHASHSLEEAAQKLQRASQAFDESVHMNRSSQSNNSSRLLDTSLQHQQQHQQPSAEALSYLMESSMHVDRPNTPPNQHRSQRLAGTTASSSAERRLRESRDSREPQSPGGSDPRLSLEYGDVAALVRQKLHDKLSRMLIPGSEGNE